MRIIRFLIVLPLAILAILFSISNRHSIEISLNPFVDLREAPTAPSFVFEVPLFLLLFAFVLFGILLGGVGAWLSQRGNRVALRHAKSELKQQHQEVEKAQKKIEALSPDGGGHHPLLPSH